MIVERQQKQTTPPPTTSTTSSVDGSVTNSPNFEAWYFHPDGVTEALTCPQGTFTTSGSYATCCNSSKCPMPTACSSNKLGFDNFAVVSCASPATCQTMSILPAPGAKSPVVSSIFCAQVWLAYEVYRDTKVISSTSTTSASTSASAGATPSSNSASVTTSATGTGTPTPTPSPTAAASSSKAWIAGAVVGPVAGIALLGAAFWFFRRRNTKIHEPANEIQEIGGYERPADQTAEGSYPNKQYYGASQPKSDSTTAGFYAPLEQQQVHELPATESRR
ncbi:hypothetical protein NQ176_g5246 [Zarea fungicola]|uniref:Uncharacterized protein n=1 Tax=Zarea fungicola TaxID=93591 RepID=A0ACC1N9F6_9HYPO|nr:hypothetical protein NQ176_g5246 [Lecanicillium fungicola]